MPNDNNDAMYSRRDFLRVLGAGALAAALPVGALAEGAAERKKQNILMIVVDDLRPQLGCYGRAETLSPNIDRFAESGTLFERAYSNVPICMASRVGALTGRRSQPDAQTCAEMKEDFVTLPALLKQNGYRCVSNGKVFHHMNDRAEDWSEPPWRSEEIYHGKHDWAGYNYYDQWQDPESAQHVNPKTKRGPFREAPDVPDDAYQDGKLANKTIADLKRLSEGDEPFFLAAGFWRPHLPFNAPKKYWDMYDGAKIAVADNRYPPKDLPEKCKPSLGEILSYGDTADRLSDVDFHREARHAYYACVSYVDAQIGRVLAELDRLGLADDTVVMFWVDHGWHLGEHDFWGKHNTLKNALQVPLIIRAPGYRRGRRTRALVENADLYPTLCDLVGVRPPSYVEGKSLVPVLENPAKPLKAAVYSRWGDGWAVKTDRYLYTEWPNGERMLYDHDLDPQENVNIAGDPSAAEIVALHRKLLATAHPRLA